jgi:hypothetical protein
MLGWPLRCASKAWVRAAGVKGFGGDSDADHWRNIHQGRPVSGGDAVEEVQQ